MKFPQHISQDKRHCPTLVTGTQPLLRQSKISNIYPYNHLLSLYLENLQAIVAVGLQPLLWTSWIWLFSCAWLLDCANYSVWAYPSS